jgi:hypothetical protein
MRRQSRTRTRKLTCFHAFPNEKDFRWPHTVRLLISGTRARSTKSSNTAIRITIGIAPKHWLPNYFPMDTAVDSLQAVQPADELLPDLILRELSPPS